MDIKMKKSVLAIMVGALCIILSSCQETPEESSVVSKVDGISEAAVCEPLKKGEKRETNVPTHWKFEEKKSNDRVVIQADIKLGEQSIGNLPVIEMQNHELTQEELNGLIDYFTDGEELYMPQMVTKDAYQEVLDRISSKEGSYLQSAYSTSIAGIQNATREGMELAPDEASAPEKMEIKFQKKTEDHGVEAARSWMSTELENTDTEDYFTADVGEDRKAYIEAERYNQEIDNDSSFLWMEGSNFIEEETIETEEMQSEYYSSFGMDTNGYTEKFHELADAYRKCMDKITFTEEDGKEQAEQVLEDLGIDGMGLVDSDRTVWFPNGACSERNGLGLGSDALWQGDLDRGLPGYLYCFSKSVEGITSVPDGVVAEETVDSYVPPFQVEQVLEDLGIDGMGLVDSDRTVWFPNGACSERNGLGLGSDALWQGDLDRGLPGYLYCFSKSVEGITSVPDGVVAEETVDSYVPPFQVETISILITEEGIKYFKWDGISEEVCTVTENTKLLPFEKIQAKLTDQIFYWYSGKGQSANDTTALEYDVVNAKLQYTYTTAYQEPKHAWLVPAWIFTVRESIGGNSLQELSYVINAYDGSVIGEAY